MGLIKGGYWESTLQLLKGYMVLKVSGDGLTV